MRIIDFSSVAAPSSFWTLPVQARAASNEAVFAMPEMPVRPGNTVKAGASAAPLRVVRESDVALDAECAGRMMISGRMADVCAELERMALRADAAQAAGAAARH